MAVITIIFGNRSRLIGLPESYAALIGKARQVFKTGDAELLIYVTLASTDQEVELDPSAYEAVSHGCSLRVTEKLDSSDCDSDSEQFNDLMQADTPGFDFLISVRTCQSPCYSNDSRANKSISDRQNHPGSGDENHDSH